ncbi:putative quinol monooxygenase [Enterobacter hormaechei]|uniref:putative quinol monooxygenase n=1 Tax=Shewanella sp. (strain ANA-3) TaxID=94122 RepID=UPI000674B6CF|nr:putative quinol monooxygenase [Shewanella sp. ANA-3]ELD4171254.1 antibiotic biosynthesis monooxygenase [Enterobacter hormaechei]
MSPVELLVSMRAHEKRIEELRDVLMFLRNNSLTEPGCLEYRLAQGQASVNRFFLVERWADNDSLSRHETTPHYLEGVARVQACCESVELQRISWFQE